MSTQDHDQITLSVPAGGSSQPIFLNREIDAAVGLIVPDGNSGYCQHTLSSRDAVLAGTARWRTWGRGNDAGIVYADDEDTIEHPSTAVRGVSVSGALTIEVLW